MIIYNPHNIHVGVKSDRAEVDDQEDLMQIVVRVLISSLNTM